MSRRPSPAWLLALSLAPLLGCDPDPSQRAVTDGSAPPATDAGGAAADGPAAADRGPPPPGGDGGGPTGCRIFPADNPWNLDVSAHAVHPSSDAIVARIGAGEPLHPDFGAGTNGIPYVVVGGATALVDVHFFDYPDESDPGPYRIPLDAPTEAGSDRHAIGVDLEACLLYELFNATPSPAQNRWEASNGAIFDLRSNALRTLGWTSADAAGLPIFPGLVRYDEVASGAIRHALRFTVQQTRRAFVLPATHWASSQTEADLPPMGLRVRLKQSVDISGYSATNQVILTALKRYGMIVADNGSNWFVSGAPDDRWDDDDLHQLRQLTGSAFEVVDTGPIRTSYE